MYIYIYIYVSHDALPAGLGRDQQRSRAIQSRLVLRENASDFIVIIYDA